MSVHTREHADVNYAGYLVAVFSQSGRTPEVVTTATRLRERGARVVAVTNDADSPLAAAADLTLELGAGPERAVPATKTVTAQMIRAAAVAAGVSVGSSRSTTTTITGAGLARLAPVVAEVLADRAPVVAAVERWRGHSTLLVVGRGTAYAAALESALKVRETAGVFAQGMSSADLLHGPIAAVGPDTPVLVLDADGPLKEDLDAIAERLVSTGAALIRWPAVLGERFRGDLGADVISTVAATVRGQQLAYAWARDRGNDPDRPSGLSKVTATF
jgi:glucosamine--fructose-6-phosphate aminotransferase (isomerizing)